MRPRPLRGPAWAPQAHTRALRERAQCQDQEGRPVPPHSATPVSQELVRNTGSRACPCQVVCPEASEKHRTGLAATQTPPTASYTQRSQDLTHPPHWAAALLCYVPVQQLAERMQQCGQETRHEDVTAVGATPVCGHRSHKSLYSQMATWGQHKDG